LICAEINPDLQLIVEQFLEVVEGLGPVYHSSELPGPASKIAHAR
jgi:hypothetical protein